MRVLVTGSSNGMGKAIAEIFVANGHEVIGLDVEGATITALNYQHIVADITKELPDVDKVEILVNNAGVQDCPEEIAVNLNGTIAVTEKYALGNPYIKSVVFNASISGTTGSDFPHYAASKGGVIAYMKHIAQDIAIYGATANSLSVGGVYTRMNKHITDSPKLLQAAINETLLKRWATPEECAKIFYFVATECPFMTGQDIMIDGGESIKTNFIW